MRPSLTIIAASLAIVASIANASPVDVSEVAAIERSPVAAPAVEQVAEVEARARKHHKNKAKHAHKKKSGTNGKATYYTGDQLNAPACGDATPSDNDMIAAVKQGSQFKCHDWVTLSKNGKSVTVKVVDMCAGCEDNHFDLSKGAFKKLGHLSEGVLTGLTYST